MPDDASKKSRLPKGRGIHKIELSEAKEVPPVPESDGRLRVEISETDCVLIEHIRTRLEAQYGTPFSNSQVIRWAIWHCV